MSLFITLFPFLVIFTIALLIAGVYNDYKNSIQTDKALFLLQATDTRNGRSKERNRDMV
jgi:uncharacterized membrane protein